MLTPDDFPPYVRIAPLYDKLSFLRESIAEVEQQLHTRYLQKTLFLSTLEQKILDVRTSILALRDQSPESSLKRGLELQISDIEREMRQQEIECWRDSTQLQRDLRQLTKEYRALRGVLCSTRKR